MGCDIHMVVQTKQGDKWWTTDYKVWDGRCYDIFAMLADVRNDGNIIPISTPRGYPADLESEYDLEGADHSHSWLLLRELLPDNPYWDQTFVKDILVVEDVYLKWKNSDSLLPDNWCRGAGGLGVLVVEQQDLEEAKRRWPDKRLYARCLIKLSYRIMAEPLLKITVPMLQLLGGPDDVRIVFGFDS